MEKEIPNSASQSLSNLPSPTKRRHISMPSREYPSRGMPAKCTPCSMPRIATAPAFATPAQPLALHNRRRKPTPGRAMEAGVPEARRCQLQIYDTRLASCHVRIKRYSLRCRIHVGTMVRTVERGSSPTCPSRPRPLAVIRTGARCPVASCLKRDVRRKGAISPASTMQAR
ncbi:hypothetical protein IG631_07555 [Alternaria alternata]|nr:hypothetical protein IG631_07555 [Alternaria alternata]